MNRLLISMKNRDKTSGKKIWEEDIVLVYDLRLNMVKSIIYFVFPNQYPSILISVGGEWYDYH